MSKDIVMQRTAGGMFAPSDQIGVEYVQSLPIGKKIGVTVTQARNYKFHQKLICLLTYLYDVMPRTRKEIDGVKYEQSFNTFRREFVAISGHYQTELTGRGTLRIEAQSISYAQCSEELAKQIYSDVIDKALEKLGRDQTREDLDEIVNEILRFD